MTTRNATLPFTGKAEADTKPMTAPSAPPASRPFPQHSTGARTSRRGSTSSRPQSASVKVKAFHRFHEREAGVPDPPL